ncbi:MAG: hypothetical protein Q8L87_17100 [Anaerolineales bacterium]|nr:hypothetical protein [Anaerolineales bacterium]
MKVVRFIERVIFESPTWKFILLVFAITLVRTGIWQIPNLELSLQIAQDPFNNPFTDNDAHYLFWNWLGPFLAWLVGAKSKAAFFLLHLTFSIAFTLLFIRIAFSRFSNQTARSALILFSVLPVSATAYFWVSTDSLTLFLILLALAFPEYALVTVISGVALGMQHFEQGFVAAGGLLFAQFLSKKFTDSPLPYSPAFTILWLIGVHAGKTVLIGLFDYFSIEINSGRAYFLSQHFRLLLKVSFFYFHIIAWSVLGLGWLVALRYIDWGRKTIPFFLALFGFCLLIPISADQTRVLAIVTFPLLATYWLFNRDFLEKLSKTEVAFLFVLWILIPWAWTWGGVPKWSVFPHDIAYIFHELLGWFRIPSDPSAWPFD